MATIQCEKESMLFEVSKEDYMSAIYPVQQQWMEETCEYLRGFQIFHHISHRELMKFSNFIIEKESRKGTVIAR